jgi:hypothetical protein
MLEQIVFDTREKTMSIDLDTLVNSSDYDRGKKFPKSHHEILSEVQKIMTEEGYENKLSELYISKSGVILPKEREVAFRTDINTIYDTRGVHITNLVAKINMGGILSDSESSQSFALSYNKNGIEVSFGTNINICSNMTIFGHGHLKNFGTNGIEFDKMFEIIRLWIKTSEERRKVDLEIIEKMKLITFTDFLKESREIIGHFNEMLIRDGNTAPLRQGRITDVHRALLTQYDKAVQFGENFNLWNMFNAFTEASSHQDVLENVIGNSAAIGQFFVDKYNLNALESEKEIIVVNSLNEIVEANPRGVDPHEAAVLEPLSAIRVDEIIKDEPITERNDLTDKQKAYAKDALADKPIMEDPGEVQADNDVISLY